MADKDQPQAPTSGQAEEPKVEAPQAPATPEQPSKETTVELPEKLKGKTVEEVAKMYVDLEKVHGKHTKEVELTRKQLEDWNRLGQVIEENPELQEAIKEHIAKKSGQAPSQPKSDDTRTTLRNKIVSEFGNKYGLNNLAEDKRKDLFDKVLNKLADMRDPSGQKSIRDIVDEIPLDRFDSYLDDAYTLATVNDREERARVEGLLQARQNSEGAFGSMPSAGAQGNINTLTPDERAAAAKLGISEDKYLASKKALQEGN